MKTTKPKKTKGKLTPIPRRQRGAANGATPAPAHNGADAARAEAPTLDHIAHDLRPLAVPCDSIAFDPDNCRLHPEDNLEAITGSLSQYGQRRPVVVNRRTGQIEAGNGLLQAALSLGWTHVAVIWVDDDPATATGYAIADNRTAELARWDQAKLAAAMGRLEEVRERMAPKLLEMMGRLRAEQGARPEVSEDAGPQIDRAEELRKKWGVKQGDLFLIPSKTVPPRKMVTCPHCDCEQEAT